MTESIRIKEFLLALVIIILVSGASIATIGLIEWEPTSYLVFLAIIYILNPIVSYYLVKISHMQLYGLLISAFIFCNGFIFVAVYRNITSNGMELMIFLLALTGIMVAIVPVSAIVSRIRRDSVRSGKEIKDVSSGASSISYSNYNSPTRITITFKYTSSLYLIFFLSIVVALFSPRFIKSKHTINKTSYGVEQKLGPR